MAKDLKIEIPSVDEIFKLSTNKGKAENVVMIPLNEISNFPNHPFKVERNEELEEMVESIKSGGVRQPVIVRAKEDGGYEMVSGHRRKLASEIAGLKEIPAIIRELTRDEATILMVDSNIQREKVLPSEKAFAYKMKLEAQKHQGKRRDLLDDLTSEILSSSIFFVSSIFFSSTFSLIFSFSSQLSIFFISFLFIF